MKKAALYLSEIGKRILFIGFSIQIILGIVWMCFNFTSLQKFTVSGAFLYQHLISKLELVFPILYALQLALAVFAGYYMLHGLQLMGSCHPFLEWWGSLAILTFPMAMQCHMAVSPYSLIGSLLLIELTILMKTIRGKESLVARGLVKAGACWLLLGLIMPEYTILGGIPVLLGALFPAKRLIHSVKKLGWILLLLVALSGVVTGTARLTGQEDILSKKNIAYSLFWRTGWTFLRGETIIWDPAILEAVMPEVNEAGLRPSAMDTALRPGLEKYLSEEEFIEFCNQRTKMNLLRHGSVILREVIWDGSGYTLTPMIVPMQLKGKGYDSCTGRNYELMRNHTPQLTQTYVRYGCWWFCCMLVIAVICLLGNHIRGIAFTCEIKNRRSGLMLCLLSFGAIVLFYTLRTAGMMDYKCTIAVNQMWVVGALSLLRKEA